jgi:CDP-diacylglycerol--glycerol-3-phosphate 3-phosphatidyltransferase
MLDQKLRVAWDRAVRPVGGSLARGGLSANAVTFLGLLIQVGAAVLILQGRLLAAGLVSVAAALCDGLDGAIAKARGTASKLGAFYDSTTDRLADALFFLPIAWLYGVAPDGPDRRSTLVAGLALMTLVASFLVSYVRARAEGLGLDAKVGIAERAERLIVMVLGLVFDVVLIALWILSVASVVTLIQRIVHVRRQARA